MKLRLALNTERKCDWEKVRTVLERVNTDRAEVQSAILEYLSEGPRTAHEIMTRLLENEFAATKGSVHKALSDVRERLNRFYKTPQGFCERFRLELPKCTETDGLQSLRITDNVPSQGATGFWAAHLSNGLPTELLLGGTPLRIENEIRIQGGDGEELKTWKEDLPRNEAEKESGEASQAYVPLPNVEAMFHLFMYFKRWHEDDAAQPEPRIFSELRARPNGARNQVILGTPFDNEVILDEEIYLDRRNQSCLFFNADCTRYRKTAANGERRVWVVRRWAPANHFETVIAASEGSALNAVCKILVGPKLDRMIRNLWANRSWKGFPPEFRMEFRVKLADDGEAESIRVNNYMEMEGWGIRKVGPSGKPEAFIGHKGEWAYPW